MNVEEIIADVLIWSSNAIREERKKKKKKEGPLEVSSDFDRQGEIRI